MSRNAEHPGLFIRREVFPTGLSVTAAARTLGVGRPALSNMLNGNAALSPEMAARIEKAFGANSQELLSLQAAYDRKIADAMQPSIAVRSFAPRIMNITALQIEAWSERLEARSELGALIRRLVVSTGEGLSKVDFPAFENSQRPGWDGFVIADSANPWIPQGASGFEFGVNQNAVKKAEDDYTARTKSVKPADRHQTTFVFVSPRNWPGKNSWADAKRGLKHWKDVRAYDASDLEQWLEGSVSGQAWLAERLPLGGGDILSLENCWEQWAAVTEPRMSKTFFELPAAGQARKVIEWLRRDPERPLTVAADSKEEALAALACLFDSEALNAEFPSSADRVVVVKSADALRKIAVATTNTIVVVASVDAERESAGIHRKHHTIVVSRRSAEDEPDLVFDIVDGETFRNGLVDMGLEGEAERLRHESGSSPTVLRRRISQFPEIRTPPWAGDKAIADALIPLMFVGAWNASSDADQAVLSAIAAGTADEIEKLVAELAPTEQSPVWSIGDFRGVVSKVDAFYAIQHRITKSELDRFFNVAKLVLSETDPSLELPEEDRWAAGIYGKTRRHSGALRQGICETLVLLSVHGDNLFRSRLGLNVEARVNQLIRELLTPFDPTTWQSQRNDLPRYAEAAPETFLDMLEEDLKSGQPEVHALMQPASSGVFSSPARSGLLWALEVLAWNPKWLPRVVLNLGQLAELELTDNWLNKPDNSLLSIFRAWMPQTAASVTERIAALQLLVQKHPAVGWRVCLDQFDSHSTIGHYNARPRRRRDAVGAGEPVYQYERHQMALAALNTAITWPRHTERTLGDLVQRLENVGPEFQEQIWTEVQNWAASLPDDEALAFLSEKIRTSTMTRQAKVRGAAAKVRARGRAIYETLKPKDPVYRYLWLFKQTWVQESADEFGQDDFDFNRHEEEIAHLRAEALKAIWDAQGYEGIARLCAMSEAAGTIGWNLAASLFDERQAADFIRAVISDRRSNNTGKMDWCLSGLLHKVSPDLRTRILTDIVGGAGFSDDQVISLLVAAPFQSATWDLVDQLKSDRRRRYWQQISPSKLFPDYSAEDINRALDELLQVERPRAAFFAVEMEFSKIKSRGLSRLLSDCGLVRNEPPDHYQMAQHDISDAFDELARRADIPKDEIASLEFMYIDALAHTRHGIVTLERQIGKSPELFIQAVALAFKRSDDGEDPPNLRPSNESAGNLAGAAYSLLRGVRRLPGTDENTGKIVVKDLREWIARVTEYARACAREEVGESCIGQLLGRAPVGEDGIWPCEPLREVLEDLGTPRIANGMMTGLFNDRGAQWRGKGGDQERGLAQKYRTWSTQLATLSPFTSRLLEGVAQMYDHDAEWHDTRDKVRQRLEY